MYTILFVLLISILDDCGEILKLGKLSYTNTVSLAHFIVSLHLLIKHFLLLVILGEVPGKMFVCLQTL